MNRFHRRPLFFLGCPNLPPQDLCTESLGKAFTPLEHNTRSLVCRYAAALINTHKTSTVVLHLSISWCISSQFLGVLAADIQDIYNCPLFLATPHQKLDPQYPIGSGDREQQQQIKWWHRDHKPLSLFPFQDAIWFSVARLVHYSILAHAVQVRSTNSVVTG